MTAIVLPDLNQQTIDDLRAHVSKLSDLDLGKIDLGKIDLSKLDTPSLEHAGKSADQAIDRLLGRSRSSLWPWLAVGIGFVAVIGAVSAWFAFIRRPAWIVSGRSTTEATTDAAENEGMTPHVPGEPFRADEYLAATRSNGVLIEDA
jgi:hypothetical protein